MKRREFLKSSTLATTGLLAAMARTSSATADAPDELAVGLIGVGEQGKVLLNAAVQLPGVKIVALCDIWERAGSYGQKFLTRYAPDVRVYRDYRDMLDKEKHLNAVLVATPDHVHAAQVNACLEAGSHVYCEPMLADSLDAARSMVATMRRTGKLLQVGYQRRSDPRYRHVAEKLLEDANLPGRITAVQTQWARSEEDTRGWPRDHAIPAKELQAFGYGSMDEFRNWIWYRKFTGGLFCTYVSQQLDVCEWFLNAVPRAVTASGGCDVYEGRENYDTVMAVYEFPEGDGTIRAACHLFAASSAGGIRQYERFLGSDASVQISQNPRWTQICREPHVDEWDTWVRKQYLVKPDIPKSYSAEGSNAAGAPTVVHVSGEITLYQLPELSAAVPYQPHLKNFFAAVRGQQPLHCPADVAFRSQVMALKALEAVRAKSTLSFEAAEFEV